MTPDQVLALVERAVREGVSSYVWLLIVISTSFAAIGAFVGGYLKKKAELAALNEHFAESLRQIQLQTATVESVKAEIGIGLATSVETLRARFAQDLAMLNAELQEGMKRESEFVAFRYKKIFEVFEDLSRLPTIDYTYIKRDGDEFVEDKELFGRVVAQATDRYAAVTQLVDRVHPLLDEGFALQIVRCVAEAQRQSALLTNSLYTGSELPSGVDVVTLTQARMQAERSVRDVLASQIAALTKAGTAAQQ